MGRTKEIVLIGKRLELCKEIIPGLSQPSGVLWADKSGQEWYRLSVEDFGKLAKKYGKKQSM
jgi:hypothetical protein